MSLIEARGLLYTYPDGTQALRGIDFELQNGETVILLGPNGSGKTTFVLHLNGLIRGKGQLTVCGMELTDQNLPLIRRKVGLVFQDSDEQLFMPTVLDDVAFGLRSMGTSVEEAFDIARRNLARVGMESAAGKAPYHLSAGEKRRVAIAGVIAMGPEVLILDEPTMFLDPPGQRELLQVLRQLPQAKLIVTHDLSFARAMGTRAVFFENGAIAGSGTVDEVIERFRWYSHD